MAVMNAADYAKTDAAKKAEAAAKAYQSKLNSTTKTPAAVTPTTSLPTGPVAVAPKFDVNEYLSQYKDSIMKPVTPFTYDINSIKSDPLYTSGLASFSKDAERGTNQSLVNLGRRGIGNSQSAVTAELAGQQSINDFANTKLAPSVIAQKYQQYLDTNQQQDKQNQNILGFANTINNLGQQGFNNDLLTKQDDRSQQAQDANFTGNYMPTGARDSINRILDLKRQAEDQGVTPEQMAQFKAAADQERANLTRLGVDPSIVGFDANYDQASQNAANFRGVPTLQGRAADLNDLQTTSNLTGKLPDGTPTYQSVQDAIKNGMSQRQIDNQASQFAESMGYNYDNMNVQDKQAWAQIAISQQNADTNKAQTDAQIANLNNPQTKPMTVDDAISQLNKSTFVEIDPDTKRISTYDQIGLAKAILSLGYQQKDTDYLFNYYNINKQEVNDYLSKQSGN